MPAVTASSNSRHSLAGSTAVVGPAVLVDPMMGGDVLGLLEVGLAEVGTAFGGVWLVSGAPAFVGDEQPVSSRTAIAAALSPLIA
jgi:hypothetical protein